MAVAVVVAAGESRRMGDFGDKQFVSLAGRPLLAHTLQAFQDTGVVTRVVLVCNAERIEQARGLAQEFGLRKVDSVVEGGRMRQESVANGLREVADDEIVAVHDGARPLITPDLIARSISSLGEWDGAVLGVPVTDTVKEVDGEHVVTGTLDRTKLWLAHTPQVFPARLLKEALQTAQRQHFAGTDDAVLVERIGGRLLMVEGSTENIKITVGDDLARAEAILARRGA